MTDEEVCQEIIDLRPARAAAAAASPPGRKWDGARRQKAEKKYIVCNGDEGDPGAFMDRSIMEGNPHSVLEGMMIAGRAAGSDEGYIYVRAEYPLAVSASQDRHRQGRGAGPAGRQHPRQRLLLPHPRQPRCGRVRLRRGQRPDRVHRGQARHAARQAAAHHRARPVGAAHRPQQRRDLRQRAALIIRNGRRLVPQHRHRATAPARRPSP